MVNVWGGERLGGERLTINSKPHPGAASSTILNVWLDFEGAVLKVAGGLFKC